MFVKTNTKRPWNYDILDLTRHNPVTHLLSEQWSYDNPMRSISASSWTAFMNTIIKETQKRDES